MDSTIKQCYKVLDSLSQSIDGLETAINSALNLFATKPQCPDSAYERMESYREIVHQQRRIVADMACEIGKQDWHKFNVLANRTNALSAMIRDDAHELLAELTNPAAKPARPEPN